MERPLTLLIALAVGFGAGYLVRDSSVERVQPRKERTTAAERPPIPGTNERRTPPLEEEPASEPRIEKERARATPASASEDEAKERKGSFADILEGGGGRLIKGMMAIDAKKQARAVAEAIGLDEERTKRLEEAFAAEAERKLGLLDTLANGGELGPEELSGLRRPDGLMSEQMERDLAGFMNGYEIDLVRGELRKEKERKEREAIEKKVKDLGVSDLSETQKEQLRRLFRDRKREKEYESAGSKLEKGKKILEDGFDTKDIIAQMEENNRRERELVSRILTTDQLERYDAHKKSELEEARMGMELFGSLFKGAKGKGTVKITLGGSDPDPDPDDKDDE